MYDIRYFMFLMLCSIINVNGLTLDRDYINDSAKDELFKILDANIKKGSFVKFVSADVEKNAAQKLDMSVDDLRVWIETKKKPVMLAGGLKVLPPLQQAVLRSEPSLQQAVLRSEPPLQQAVLRSEPSLQQAVLRSEPPLQQAVLRSEPSLQQAVLRSEPSLQQAVLRSEPPLQQAVLRSEPPLQQAVLVPVSQGEREAKELAEGTLVQLDSPAYQKFVENNSVIESLLALFDKASTIEFESPQDIEDALARVKAAIAQGLVPAHKAESFKQWIIKALVRPAEKYRVTSSEYAQATENDENKENFLKKLYELFRRNAPLEFEKNENKQSLLNIVSHEIVIAGFQEGSQPDKLKRFKDWINEAVVITLEKLPEAATRKNLLQSIQSESTKAGLKKVELGQSPGKKVAASESLLGQITSQKNRLKNAQERQLADKPAEPETVFSQIRQGTKLKAVAQ